MIIIIIENLTQTIRQTLDPGTGDDLPNYTPDADPADCRADNLVDSYEKVFFVLHESLSCLKETSHICNEGDRPHVLAWQPRRDHNKCGHRNCN